MVDEVEVDHWEDLALCRGHGGMMFPEADDWAGIAAAKAVCAVCPVAGVCLAVAFARREMAGVWGGMTEEERKDYSKGRRQLTLALA